MRHSYPTEAAAYRSPPAGRARLLPALGRHRSFFNPPAFGIPSFYAFGLVALAIALFLCTPLHAQEQRCARAKIDTDLQEALPNLRSKVEAGESIRIVAIGSSSTAGTSDLPREAVYPNILKNALARLLLTPIEMINKGKGGETIPHMFARLERDVLNEKPDLVIWQLGVNDVLVYPELTPALLAMRAGLDKLRAMRLPVILMDLQTGPMVENAEGMPRMQAAIEAAAQADGVSVFRRFQLMQALRDSGAAPQELTERDGLHMTRLAHLCTGISLATSIADASLSPPRRGTPSAQLHRASVPE